MPNIPLSIAVGLLGVAQTSLIASQPIPEFKTGVRDFEGGLAILGDGGVSEYARTPDGQVFKTPNKDTLYNLPKGTDVFKNEASFMMELKSLTDMNNIMFDSSLINAPSMPEINVNNSSLDTDAMRVMFKGLEKTIKTKSSIQIVKDEYGYQTYIKNQSSRTKLLNNKINIKK